MSAPANSSLICDRLRAALRHHAITLYATLLFLLLLAPVPIHAASIDCSKASTLVERAICSSPELRKADDQLAEAYHGAMTKVPEAATLVRDSQQNWLRSVEQICKPADKHYPFLSCLADEWKHRAEFLTNIVNRINGVPFFYHEYSQRKSCAQDGAESSPQPKGADDLDSCAFDATWPEAISNAPAWRAWNRAVLDEARRFHASQDTENNIPDHWVYTPDLSWHSDDQVSVEVDWASPTLVTATINRNYTYAHPANQERAFNWLLHRGRELESDDLFQTNSGWQVWMKGRVTQIVFRYETSELNETVSDAKEITASAARVAVEPRYWKIDRKGLTLIFTQEELGYPTALTMPEITFTWSDLKPYLNPDFKIAQ
jgi:uncharacterized protein YecT (DUF1311 family)